VDWLSVKLWNLGNEHADAMLAHDASKLRVVRARMRCWRVLERARGRVKHALGICPCQPVRS
jgi:hypothetical protein